jgi:hypothetical protein
MKTKNTLLDAWIAGWKLHIFFYPFYFWIWYDMMPKLFNQSNDNPLFVKIMLTLIVIVIGIIGIFRFAYLWYKNK